MDQKHTGGRRLKFQSVKEFQTKIDAYFSECEREEDIPTFPTPTRCS